MLHRAHSAHCSLQSKRVQTRLNVLNPNYISLPLYLERLTVQSRIELKKNSSLEKKKKSKRWNFFSSGSDE